MADTKSTRGRLAVLATSGLLEKHQPCIGKTCLASLDQSENVWLSTIQSLIKKGTLYKYAKYQTVIKVKSKAYS